MNKYIKLFALAGASFLLDACQEELVPENIVVPGDEIQFGANAYFENGEPQTRTEYGDIQDNQIEVRWVPEEDRVDIACPNAVGSTNSEYKVAGTVSGETVSGVADNYKANTLVRLSPVGLQWSGSDEHVFYASYPSKNQIAAKLGSILSQKEIGELGLNEATGKLKGFLPLDQSPAQLPAGKTNRGGKAGWVVEPDMTYAYMVERKTHAKGQSANIGLRFESQVTALEFEVLAGDFAKNVTQQPITILAMQLYHNNNEQICGHFEYTYAETDDAEGTFVSKSTNGYEKITQTFGNGLVVAPGEFVDATFFLLPGQTFSENNSGELSLTVIYKVGNNPNTKTATLTKEITPKKKYFFSNVQLPDVESLDASSWFAALNPATYISQLSIPVAGNAFSYYYVDKDNTTDNEKFYRQQVKDYETLWKMGVRGFEFKTSYNKDANVHLGGEYFVCNGQEIDNGDVENAPTFDKAFTTLYNHLQKNPNETLVIIATYQSHGESDAPYSPQAYISDLEAYLTAFCTANNITNKGDKFAKLGTNSCVGDLRGKIAIVIRPGDDDYMNLAGVGTSYKVSTTWSNYLALVRDWGTGIDQWDKRYGSSYYTEGVFAKSGKTIFESNMAVLSSTDGETMTDTGLGGKIPSSSWNLSRTIGNSGTGEGTAYVQCWERVVPVQRYWRATTTSWGNVVTESDNYQTDEGDTELSSKKGYLWINWFESLREKKQMVMHTVETAQDTYGKTNSSTLYINSLSGYFVTEELEESLYPYTNKILVETDKVAGKYTNLYNHWEPKLDLSNQGKGGDWESCAAEMNTYLWTELNASQKQGPLGLIMFDYIDAETTHFANIKPVAMNVTAQTASKASKELPGIIMMNNFLFPLTTNPDWKDPNENNGNKGGGIGSTGGGVKAE